MKNIVLMILVSAAVAFTAAKSATTAPLPVKETVYERVMRTGKIRCGYNAEAPFVVVDPNTLKLSGAGVEIVEEMGELLGLKIEWTEQVGWDLMASGLQTDRYDLVCNGKWVLAPHARESQFTAPIYFSTVHAYGRNDETRFDADIQDLNDGAYTITSMDGEINFYTARDIFPRAKRIEFPSMTDNGQLFEAVLTKKADVTFAAGFLGNDYMKHNPGSMKKISKQPISLFDTAFMFKTGESAFAGILDSALRQMHAAGTIRAILDQHHVSEDDAKRVVLPVAP